VQQLFTVEALRISTHCNNPEAITQKRYFTFDPAPFVASGGSDGAEGCDGDSIFYQQETATELDALVAGLGRTQHFSKADAL